MKKIALPLLLSFLITPVMAQSYEALRFRPAENYKQKQIIQFIKNKTQTADISEKISKIDLNNDLIDEYIVKQGCAPARLCQYFITAFENHTPILIGRFDAHKILISDKKDYGIRQIIVYNQPHNDFTHATAIWNPHKFEYTLF